MKVKLDKDKKQLTYHFLSASMRKAAEGGDALGAYWDRFLDYGAGKEEAMLRHRFFMGENSQIK